MSVIPDEARETIREAHLRYVDDRRPGYRRIRRGEKEFDYLDVDGKKIGDPQEIERIQSLGIPPAWTDVWICPHARGHIQATGRDARGRKQYLYHPKWREVRDAHKFERVVGFVDALPGLREKVEADLREPGLPKEKVVALIIELMQRTLIRIGNREYELANGSHGLTTLHDEHVNINGGRVVFDFVGKHGKEHHISLQDRRLARLVKKVQDLPGHELFQFIDPDGERRVVESADVNDYLRRITGDEFTAKDFRTWGATKTAAVELCDLPPCDRKIDARRNVSAVIKSVAKRLGNTPALCRKAYVHPAVPGTYLEGRLQQGLEESRMSIQGRCPSRLEEDEAAVAEFLRSLD